MNDAGQTVLIVDDHPVFRRGLRSVLEDAEGVGAIVEASTVEEAVRMAVAEHVDVVALDLTLPDGSGLDATIRLRRARPGLPILILTMHDDPSLVGPLLAAGARGYMVKETDGDLIVEALRTITRGATVLGPHLDPATVTVRSTDTHAPSAVDRLTPRERDILAELAAGQTNAQIGRRLGLSEKTIRNHLTALYLKLGVNDRTQAALQGRGLGLAPPTGHRVQPGGQDRRP